MLWVGQLELFLIANIYSPVSTVTLTILKVNADTDLAIEGVYFDLIPVKADGT